MRRVSIVEYNRIGRRFADIEPYEQEEIRKKILDGKTYDEIFEEHKICKRAYQLCKMFDNLEDREAYYRKKSEKYREYINNLPEEVRNKRRREKITYMKGYVSHRYRNDEEFRERMKAAVRKCQKKGKKG